MLTRRLTWYVAIVATLTMTVSYIDRQTLSVLAPAVTEALGISNESYGWLASVFNISYLFATPFAGWWIDRAGARRGLLASVLAWSIVAALHAVVPGFGVLLAIRLALGVAEAPGFPGAAQTVQRVMAPHERERAFGVLFTGSSIGAMLVPPLATLIYRHAGWRIAFLLTAVAGLAWLPLWLAATRSPEVRAQLDPGAAPSKARSHPRFLALATHPITVRAMCGVVATAPVFYLSQLWGAKYLVRTFGLTQGDVGHYLWLPPLMFDAGAVLFGDLASRQRRAEGVPPRALHAIGIVLATEVALLPWAQTPWQSMIIMGIAAGGSGAAYTLITADLLGRMPPSIISFAGGILACAQSIALIVSSPLIGYVVDQRGDYDAIGIGLAVWVLPGSLAWLLWRPPLRFEMQAELPSAQIAR